jgi:hypothetical protein
MRNLFTFFVAFVACFGLKLTKAQAQTQTVRGEITSNQTWTADKIWELDGIVYVTNGAKLTIEPGTIIIGKVDQTTDALVITRGCQIIAEGTAQKPIVFTSGRAKGDREPGDFGGLVLLGNAPINVPGGSTNIEGIVIAGNEEKTKYGGTNPADNSGILKYVRVEFAGKLLEGTQGNELNSFTFGGVGSGTQVSHLQASFGNDDAFEFFGGTVDAKYLFSYSANDDDFDTDFGYVGKVQYGLTIREISNFSDGSNGFESDNDAGSSNNTPVTGGTFSNITVVGPKVFGTLPADHKFRSGALLRRNTALNIANSVFVGFLNGLELADSVTNLQAKNGNLKFTNNLVAANDKPLTVKKGQLNFAEQNWFEAGPNEQLPNIADVKFTRVSFTDPDFRPATGSPLLSGAAFTAGNLTNSFFDKVSYRGAFDGTNNWLADWTNLDPNNTEYKATTTSIDAQIARNSITLYPNPTEGVTRLQFNGVESAIGSVCVLDLTGRTVLTQVLNVVPGVNTVELNTTGLRSGIYAVQIAVPAGIETLKLQVKN